MKELKCFVSYSHESPKVDTAALEYVIRFLRKSTAERYKLLIDRDLIDGCDIEKFMGGLDSANVCIIFYTPSYKQKVESRTGGVYREYTKILLRLSQNEQLLRKSGTDGATGQGFHLIPILLIGTESLSVPDALLNYKYRNLTDLFVSRKGSHQLQVPRASLQECTPVLRSISATLDRIAELYTNPSLNESRTQLYQRLFLDRKTPTLQSGSTQLASLQTMQEFTDDLFVKTFSYKAVKNQSEWLLIGRKGAGKSTVAAALAARQPKSFKGCVAFSANEINLNIIFELFDPEQTRSDTTNIFPRMECFKYAWEALLYISAFCILIDLRDNKGHLSRKQANLLGPIEEAVKIILNDHMDIPAKDRNATFFVYCFAQITSFVDECIKGSAAQDQPTYIAHVRANFTLPRFLEFCFGEDAIQAFSLILKTCKRSFLVTLDGFDEAFDVFRKSTLSLGSNLALRVRRSTFEIDWLQSLLHLILDIKTLSAPKPDFYRLMNFCMTVPHERFLEILSTNREAHRFQRRYRTLAWSGIELAILLRKRLEVYNDFRCSQDPPAEQRLSQVMRRGREVKNLPERVTFEFNGKHYDLPLFMYVLRHTFWRPRDLLVFYADLLLLADKIYRKDRQITSEDVRDAISRATYDIVRDEFLNELKGTFLNIYEVIKAFGRATQILPARSLQNILADIRFEFVHPEIVTDSFEMKVSLLFQLGFLGIHFKNPPRGRRHNTVKDVFIFTEGSLSLPEPHPRGYDEFTFCIHPIFCEYLSLDTSGNDLVLGNLTWSYLHETENSIFKFAN